MFTVVIAQKEHLDNIQENMVFLEPFIDKRNVAFCEWKTDEQSLMESVPKLEQTVSRRDTWRAVIVCSDEGLHQKNPFDLVTFKAPVRTFDTAPMDEPESDEVTGKAKNMDLDEITDVKSNILDERLNRYLRELKKAKFAAFEQAVRNPLTRLVTYLCQPPMVTKGINRASEDPEFNEYLEENRKKQELRMQILNGEQINFSLPADVFCVALRTYENPQYDIPTAWVSHEDLQYSKFYDQNMYFNRMRYFVFDILPKNHNNYVFDYIRFLYALLILANNEVPTGALRPERVYSLHCENDEDALDQLLSAYVAKMNATVGDLESRIKEREKRQKERLSDREANAIFCANVPVPVSYDHEIDTTELFADTKAYKLSEDCPLDEHGVWKGQLKTAQKTLKLLLKQPRRALKKASSDLHRMSEADYEKALLLNEFQVEDLEDHIAQEELQMVNTDTMSLINMDEYDQRMQKEDDKICKKIETRMTRKITLALGGVVILLYLIGFLPLILNNLRLSKTILGSVLVIAIAFGLLVLVILVTLLCLRRAMRKTVQGFNNVMYSIKGELDQSMMQYSKYLSSACNVMRGYSVLNYRMQTEDVGSREVRILRKHILDIQKRKAEIEDIFGRYITGTYDLQGIDTEGYALEFYRATDYEFPLPYKESDTRSIEFIENGNMITVPVRFVRSLKVKREELYD